MHRLAQSVLGYVRKHDLLRAGDHVGVAVSGGADSVALLRLILEFRNELGIVLCVIHVNHNLRGSESDADEKFVGGLARSYGLDFLCESCAAQEYAAEMKLSLEAAARQLRYAFFHKLLTGAREDLSLTRIATAHTLNDQAETLLLKLARGAGTRGLAGVYPKLGIQPSALGTQPTTWIVRPLLGTRREEVNAYLTESGQNWREDSSNRDLRHTRNRVRHGILPRFERHVNPSVCEALAETAEIARAEEDYWSGEIARLLPEVWRKDRQGGILNRKLLNDLLLALRRRLVRAAGESLGLKLEFKHIEGILGLDSVGCSVFLPAWWSARRHAEEIKFRKRARSDNDYKYELSVPGKAAVLEAGLGIEALLVEGLTGEEEYRSEDLLGLGFAQHGLIVRSWRAGERFWPAHTREPKKIKELLQDRHITGEEKRRWPVITSGGEVVWVRGFGVRRDFQARENGGVLIREHPLDGE